MSDNSNCTDDCDIHRLKKRRVNHYLALHSEEGNIDIELRHKKLKRRKERNRNKTDSNEVANIQVNHVFILLKPNVFSGGFCNVVTSRIASFRRMVAPIVRVTSVKHAIKFNWLK